MAIHKDQRFRRHQDWKAKESAKFVMRHIWDYDDKNFTLRNIGRLASTHCKPCSCPMCGNPRKHFNELTVQERRSEEWRF